MQVYFYRDSLEKSGWKPFSLTEEDGKKWNIFCQRLALTGRKEAPYFDDYLTFLNELETKYNANEKI